MTKLSCADARDLSRDLLDGEFEPELARLVEEHVAGCPTCPSLYRGLVAVHRELTRLRRANQAAESGGGG